jgi:hypothetical protein
MSLEHFLLGIGISDGLWIVSDRLCGLVIRIPGSRGVVSIPGGTRFSKEYWVWNRVHSAS